MRVIAGHLKGRHLTAPHGAHVRPTADRVKEALFSILGSKVVGARVLDLYAGTGALGIEALSRGAIAVTFVEHHPQALLALRHNLRECGVQRQSDVQACRVDTFLAKPRTGLLPYHLLLADPPYRDRAAVEQWDRRLPEGLLDKGGVIVLEHAQKDPPPPSLADRPLMRTYAYGDTALSIYRPSGPEPSA